MSKQINNQLFDLIDKYEKLILRQAAAEKEKLPPSSKNLRTILKNIEALDTYQARVKYAESNLKHLSQGSSRMVYLSPKNTIIKLAKNDRGIAQNKVESNPKMKSVFLNEIISYAKNGSWLQTHYLEEITEKEFEELTGVNFKDFGKSLKYGVKKSSGSVPKGFDEISKTPVYKEMKRLCDKFDLLPGDLIRISSWKQRNGKPILADSGLTREIYDAYY